MGHICYLVETEEILSVLENLEKWNTFVGFVFQERE